MVESGRAAFGWTRAYSGRSFISATVKRRLTQASTSVRSNPLEADCAIAQQCQLFFEAYI